MVKILLIEILIMGIILIPLISLNIKINRLNKFVKEQNADLRELIANLRSIFKLSGEYVEILHKTFRDKISSLIVLIGEVTSYSIVRKLFEKHYQNFIIGFNIARLFW